MLLDSQQLTVGIGTVDRGDRDGSPEQVFNGCMDVADAHRPNGVG